MGKIIVIGAGQGGLVAAKHLKNFGHDVAVYEAESRENAAHPWRDDIRRAVFEEAGLTPIPTASRKTNGNSCRQTKSRCLKCR